MSEKNHDFGSLVCIYSQFLPKIREKAKTLGYAIAIHGTMSRDLDLIAVPWVEEAVDPITLVREIADAVSGYIIGDLSDRGRISQEPTLQPHGRMSWNICWGGKAFIDLSVMPRLCPLHKAAPKMQEAIEQVILQIEAHCPPMPETMDKLKNAAAEAKKHCSHERLTEEGWCRSCGEDCRGIHG